MNTSKEEEDIRIGNFVQLKASGLQGIVYKVFNDLWEYSPDSREAVLEWLQQLQPNLTEDSVPNERFILIAYLNSQFLYAFESDVQVITENEVKFSEYPKAFTGHIVEVLDRRQAEFPYWNKGYELRIVTKPGYKPMYHPNTLFIADPTNDIYEGDVVSGTENFVVISNDEWLAFPYRREDNLLIRDWE